MSKKIALAALTALVSAAVVPVLAAQAATPSGLTYAPVASWWGTNGRVTDIVSLGNRVYLSGGFDYIGPQTGYGTAVDGRQGVKLAGAPVIDGTVYATVSDGAGGWYVGGSFKTVGGLARKNAARITATGTVAKWNPKPNNTVFALAVSGNEVVLGGSFSQVGKASVTANRLGAVDLTLGTAIAGFSASVDGTVRDLLAVGSSVYVSGDPGPGSGQTPGTARVRRLNATNGSVDSAFAGEANATVRSLALSPDGLTLYAGGDFSQAYGRSWQARSRLAAWSTSTGALQAWAPVADASVEAVATDPASGTVYAGGMFTSVGGAARARLAAIDAGGVTASWDAALSGCQTRHIINYAHSNPPCTPEVSSLSVDNGSLYVGGRFGQSGTSTRHDAAAFNVATGSLTGWDPIASDRVLTLGASSGNIFVGGELTSLNGLVRKGVAALDVATGAGDPGFTADTDDLVLDLQPSPDGSTLFLAGHFQTVNGLSRKSIAAVSSVDGSVANAFKADTDNDVLSLGFAGGALFASGQFIRVNGTSAVHAVKLNPLTGAVDPAFNVSTNGPSGPLRANGMVQSMVVSPDGSKLFLGGPFNAVNGASVANGVVAVSGTTGALLASFGSVEACGSLGPWIVRLAISPDGRRLYGGDICPDRIYQWDAVALTTSQNPTGLIWKSWCNGGMQGALEVNGRFYYGSHGGDKGSGGRCWASPTNHTSVVQSRYAVFDATSGALLPDSPQFSSPMGVWSFAVIPQGLLVGGDFAWAVNSKNVRQGLALFAGTP
ncbi:MAG: hypothetical protein ABI662_11895 [Dermatophilaceae bacterium]